MAFVLCIAIHVNFIGTHRTRAGHRWAQSGKYFETFSIRIHRSSKTLCIRRRTTKWSAGMIITRAWRRRKRRISKPQHHQLSPAPQVDTVFPCLRANWSNGIHRLRQPRRHATHPMQLRPASSQTVTFAAKMKSEPYPTASISRCPNRTSLGSIECDFIHIISFHQIFKINSWIFKWNCAFLYCHWQHSLSCVMRTAHVCDHVDKMTFLAFKATSELEVIINRFEKVCVFLLYLCVMHTIRAANRI